MPNACRSGIATLRRRPGVTDQQGTDTLGAGRIPETMKKAGVREVDDEVREIRSLGFERLRLPELEIKKVVQPPRLLVELHSNIEYEVSR